MSRSSGAPRVAVWLGVNAALLAIACLAWGGLDALYVRHGWTIMMMQQINDGFVIALPGLAMLANLWLLRNHGPAIHLFGALASALVVTALWWMTVALAGGAFHAAIGGLPV